MTNDKWQFLIGLAALIDALYLISKLRGRSKTRLDKLYIVLSSATRLYLAALYLFDGWVPRSQMEPLNTFEFSALALLFIVANMIHWTTWQDRKKKP